MSVCVCLSVPVQHLPVARSTSVPFYPVVLTWGSPICLPGTASVLERAINVSPLQIPGAPGSGRRAEASTERSGTS